MIEQLNVKDVTEYINFREVLKKSTTWVNSTNAQKIYTILKNKVYKIYVAKLNRIVGTLIVSEGKNTLYIDLIAVSAKENGKGIGKILINFATSYAKSLNKIEIKLNVNRSNSDAIAFYKKVGFSTTSTGWLQVFSKTI